MILIHLQLLRRVPQIYFAFLITLLSCQPSFPFRIFYRDSTFHCMHHYLKENGFLPYVQKTCYFRIETFNAFVKRKLTYQACFMRFDVNIPLNNEKDDVIFNCSSVSIPWKKCMLIFLYNNIKLKYKYQIIKNTSTELIHTK